MSALARAAARELTRRALPLAIQALLVGLAACLVVAFGSMWWDVARSVDQAYDRLGMMDCLVTLRDAPASLVNEVRAVPGVRAAEVRRTLDGRLGTGRETVSAHVVGIPLERELTVNRLHLTAGHWPTAREALLESRFARAHQILPGSTVRLSWPGQEASLRVAGWADSPEYIWLTRTRFDPRPSLDRLAIVYLGDRELGFLKGDPSVQELTLRGIAPPALARVEQLLGSHRAPVPPLGRSDLASPALVTRDLRTLGLLAVGFPAPLLLLTLTLLGLQLSRSLRERRSAVGVLLSLGADPPALYRYLLGAPLVAMAAGTLLGSAAGAALGQTLTHAYVKALGAPFVAGRVHPELGLAVLTVVLTACGGLGVATLRPLLRRAPVEVLRAEFQPVRGVARGAGPLRLRLAARGLFRHPRRSLASLASLVFGGALLVLVAGLWGNQERVLDHYLRTLFLFDLEVDLRQPVSRAELPPVHTWPEVHAVEPVLRLPALVASARRSVPMGIWGLPPAARLYGLVDLSGNAVRLPRGEDVLALGPVQFERLESRPGAVVNVQLEDTRSPARPYRLGPALDEMLPGPAKMALPDLQRKARDELGYPPEAVTKLLVKARPRQGERLRTRLQLLAQVESVESVQDIESQVRAFFAPLRLLELAMAGLAGLLSLTLLVGTALLNVAERRPELALLSSIGIPQTEVRKLFLAELGLLWLLATALAWPLGASLADWLINRFQPGFLHVPVAVGPLVWLGSALATALLAGLATEVALRTAPQ